MTGFLFWYYRGYMSDTFEDFLNQMASGKKAIDFKVHRGTDIQLGSHVPFGVPSGIPQLDLSIGRRGYPAGRIIEIFGFEHSGKSCAALSAVASVQRMGGYAVWIDTEYCFDANWAIQNGCDPNRISVAETECIEGIFEIQRKAIESYDNLDEKVPFIVVADSITGVPSKESLDRGFDEVNRLGTDARAIRSGLKKLNSSIAKSKMLFMFINHSIAETNGMFASSNSAGGHALKFFAALRLKLTRTGNITKEEGDEKHYQGMKVKLSLEKNKIGKTGSKAFECLLLENGFDLYENLFDGFQKIGVIQKVNARSYIFEPTQTQLSKKEWKTFVDEHTQGLAKAYDWFLDQAESKGFIKNFGIDTL